VIRHQLDVLKFNDGDITRWHRIFGPFATQMNSHPFVVSRQPRGKSGTYKPVPWQLLKLISKACVLDSTESRGRATDISDKFLILNRR
jgi:hypothetical protein